VCWTTTPKAGRAFGPCLSPFARYDAVVVSTAHEFFKRPELYAGVKLVVDTRNMMAPMFGTGAPGPRIVKA
jgi:UDP-N-acetyl-D-glucosamine dehydrogenase